MTSTMNKDSSSSNNVSSKDDSMASSSSSLSSPFALWRDGSSELLLTIVSFLNVRDGNSLSATCRRAYYWVHQYRRLRGPEFVAAADNNPLQFPYASRHSQWRKFPRESLVQQALHGMQAPPDLCLSFHETIPHSTSPTVFMSTALPIAELPPSTVVLGVESGSAIPTVLGGNISNSEDGDDNDGATTTTGTARQSYEALFLASLSSSTSSSSSSSSQVFPFCWHTAEYDSDKECPEWTTEDFLPQLLQQQQQQQVGRTPSSTATGTTTNSTITTTSTTTNDANNHNNNTTTTTNEYWKVMIVYVTDGASSEVEFFLHTVQTAFPHLQIVGGLCKGGFVSLPHDDDDAGLQNYTNQELLAYLRDMGIDPISCLMNSSKSSSKASVIQLIQQYKKHRPYRLGHINDGGGGSGAAVTYADGIFGIVLGGEVPVETVVSRGVQSIVTQGPPTPTSDFVAHDAVYHVPTDEAYMFHSSSHQQDALPPYHMIRSVRHCPTGQIISVSDWTRAHGACDLVGIRNGNDDGFALHMPHPLSRNLGGFLLFQDTTLPLTSSLQNYQIDMYTLDGPACRADVHNTLQALQREVSHHKLLGACMISCAARGPDASSMMREPLADAAAWAQHFPTVPLLGWYAGGEIGPRAMAGRKRALRGRRPQEGATPTTTASSSQRAALQGFTAVFALWIVPVVDWKSVQTMLDDSIETVEKFCHQRLMQRK